MLTDEALNRVHARGTGRGVVNVSSGPSLTQCHRSFTGVPASIKSGRFRRKFDRQETILRSFHSKMFSKSIAGLNQFFILTGKIRSGLAPGSWALKRIFCWKESMKTAESRSHAFQRGDNQARDTSHWKGCCRAAAHAAAEELRRLDHLEKGHRRHIRHGRLAIDTLAALTSISGLPWRHVLGFHMDEYVGLDENHLASFRRYYARKAEPTRGHARLFSRWTAIPRASIPLPGYVRKLDS